MAPTFKHGKSGYLSMSDTGGSTFNASSGIDGSSLDRVCKMEETSAYGDDDRTYIPGLRDATIPVSAHFASTYDEKLTGMIGNSTATNWVWGPAGNTAGLRKHTGSAHLSKLSISVPVDGKISASFDMQVTGPITSTTF